MAVLVLTVVDVGMGLDTEKGVDVCDGVGLGAAELV